MVTNMDTYRLKELRIKKSLTQTQLGELLGFSNQRYNYYETGKREPDNETLVRISDFFAVSTDYLLGNTDDPTPASAKKEAPPMSLEEALWNLAKMKFGRDPTPEELDQIDLAADVVVKRLEDKNK